MAVGVPALRGAGVVRPLAEGPRNRRHGRPADPVSGARRRGLAHRRELAAFGIDADALTLCAQTACFPPRKASPDSGTTSISPPIPACRPTPIRPNCRLCSPGRRRRSTRAWSSRAISSSPLKPASRLSIHPGSPCCTTPRQSGNRKRSPPAGFARPCRRSTSCGACLERRWSIAERRLRCPSANGRPTGFPVVPNARRVLAGHRLRLVIASADEVDKTPTVLGFTHVVVREASRNTIYSGSRLWLPLLHPPAAAPA